MDRFDKDDTLQKGQRRTFLCEQSFTKNCGGGAGELRTMILCTVLYHTHSDPFFSLLYLIHYLGIKFFGRTVKFVLTKRCLVLFMLH